MTTHLFICTNCQEESEQKASLKDGPPNMSRIPCPKCSATAWEKVWVANNIIWKATGLAGTGNMDAQRKNNEFEIDR